MSLSPRPWNQPFPEFGGDDGTDEALPYVLPEFSTEEITSPDGEFVSAQSSPSIPSCSGPNKAEGKLIQVQISASGDDGTVVYSVFYNDRVWFGTSTPAS